MSHPTLITTPIYYLNDRPHIGHAYTTLAADVMARFWRLDGRTVYFATGTDEHGQKIAQAAEKCGRAPQEHVDQLSDVFRQMMTYLNVTHDDFIRTTEERHRICAQALWTTLVDKGHIYKGTYAGWYAVRDEAYYDEKELLDGKAPTGAPVEWVEEDCYFFRLSAWQQPLLDFYARCPDFILPPSRYNEVKRFVEGGLRDLAVSRSTFSWGVPVPGDEQHVMYVWIEALSNYITVLGYPDQSHPKFKDFWPNAYHLVGKDILRFHAVYWPAFLMAADVAPPHRLFAHGWWTNEGQKISKSLGNVIDPLELIEQYGLDAVRYFLFREVPFGQDGDFSHAAIQRRINSDLANDLGNLMQRVLVFVEKHRGGCVPPSHPEARTPEGQKLLDWSAELHAILTPLIEQQAFHRYLEHVWEGVSLCNQFIDLMRPWVLVKSNDKSSQEVLDETLWILLNTLYKISLFLQPFIPDSAERMLNHLGIPSDGRLFASSSEDLVVGQSLPSPRCIFPRYLGEEKRSGSVAE